MENAAAGLNEYLRVGLPAILQFDLEQKNAPRHKTRVRGWQKGSFIVLDRPQPGESFETPQLRTNQECVIRFLSEGVAVGFGSRVLALGFSRIHPQVSIAWPQEMTTMAVRSIERIHVDAPCSVLRPGGAPLNGRLQDLTAYGCRIDCDHTLPKGTELRVSCELSPGLILRECRFEVIGMGKTDHGHFCRCRLSDGQESSVALIKDLIHHRVQEGAPDLATQFKDDAPAEIGTAASNA